MLLRSNNRKKDRKDHRYFDIVENHRIASDKAVQRTVLYLREINDQQQAAWRKTLSVFDALIDRRNPYINHFDFRQLLHDKIEKTYGKAKRMWVMDRGVPTEEILQEMRDPAREIFYLVGTARPPNRGPSARADPATSSHTAGSCLYDG